MMAQTDVVLRLRLRALIDAYQQSQVIGVVARLGVADVLADGPRSCDEIAREVGAHSGALTRLLQAAAALDLVRHEGGDVFALTPLGRLLCRDDPSGMRAWAIHGSQASSWAAWGQLERSVRTGEAAFPRVHGMDVWAYRATHPEIGRAFDAAMAASGDFTTAIAEAYDFSDCRVIVDIGGGYGGLLTAILRRYPAARGILLERPEVAARAKGALTEAGVGDRCSVVAGDCFVSVPSGGDCYLLKGVLHDWNDEQAIRILTTCRRHMASGARLLVIERLVDDDTDASTRFMDLHMLVVHGGAERTWHEFARLLGDAGFTTLRRIPIEVGVAIIEARA